MSAVAKELVYAIIRLLRKTDNPSADTSRWERHLSKFCLKYSIDDAAEIRELGFKNLETTVKLRVLKVWTMMIIFGNNVHCNNKRNFSIFFSVYLGATRIPV